MLSCHRKWVADIVCTSNPMRRLVYWSTDPNQNTTFILGEHICMRKINIDAPSEYRDYYLYMYRVIYKCYSIKWVVGDHMKHYCNKCHDAHQLHDHVHHNVSYIINVYHMHMTVSRQFLLAVKLIFAWTKWLPFRRRHFQTHFLE